MKLTDLRGILQYIPQFREKTFVLSLDGAIVTDENFATLLLDVAVLRSLNIRVVLVHGASAQIRVLAEEQKVTPSNLDGSGVTDDATLKLAQGTLEDRTAVAKILGMTMNDVRLNIAEIRKPELDAKLVAEGISQQLEKRVMFRRAMKRAVTNTMRSGALGIKVRISGRLNGSEIARTETNREGRVPLHTFRADIDYGLAEAQTTYGVIGIKVWIFKGEVFDKPEAEGLEADAEAAAGAKPAETPAPAQS